MQHTRLPSPSLSPGVCSNSCPLNRQYHPTISSSAALFLPSIFPSMRVFSSELALRIRWPKYWSFSISPSNEYSELTSFRIDRTNYIQLNHILHFLGLCVCVCVCVCLVKYALFFCSRLFFQTASPCVTQMGAEFCDGEGGCWEPFPFSPSTP